MDIAEGEMVDIRDKVFETLRSFQGTTGVMDYLQNIVDEVERGLDNYNKFGDFDADLSRVKKNPSTVDKDGSKENNIKVKKEKTDEPVRRSTRATKVLGEITTNAAQRQKTELEKIVEDDTASAVVKQEMPPPQQPPRRKKKGKNTGTASSEETIDYGRDSDVVVQDPKISVVNLVESDEDEVASKLEQGIEKTSAITREEEAPVPTVEPAEETTRTTRTKTRQRAQLKSKRTEQAKRSLNQSSSEEELKPTTKRSKSFEEPVFNQTYVKTDSQKEAPPRLDETTTKPTDATVVIEKPTNVANETVVLSKAGPVVVTTPLNARVNLNDLMTDDEDEREVEKEKEKTPVRQNGIKKKVTTKPIFSTFENSPVKKRVEAFEKLNAEIEVEAPRMTRTKTKAKQESKEQQQEAQPEKESTESSRPSKLPVIDKSRLTPQHQNRFLPSAFGNSSSASKACKTGLRDITLPARSASALKACQAEFIEREMKRQKEQDAIKKREALLQAKKEESRRKREEKQQKAQSARAAIEKDKQKMLEEAERAKEEKYRQLMAEKNEKLQRQKEEAEARRLLAMKKAQEEKRREENRREKQDEHKKPVYLDQSAPLLPTVDCYDSDDERQTSSITKPDWARKQNMYPVLKTIHYAGDRVKNSLFMCEATTPDLREIFEKINPHKLKRTSSAVWRNAPSTKYMPMPSEESILEDVDY